MKERANSRAARGLVNSAPLLVGIVIYSALFIAGAFEGVRGVVLPLIRVEFGISNTALGALIFISFAGFIVAALLSGFVADVITDKPTMIIGFLILGSTVLVFPLVRSFPFLILTYFLARFGMGTVDIVASSQGTRLFQRKAAIKLNLLHVMFALGAVIAPVVGSRLLDAGVQWRRIFMLFSIPCAAFLCIGFYTTFAPQSPRPVSALRKEFASIVFSKNIWILGALLAVAIIGEANLVDWIKNYSIEIGGLSTLQSGNIIGLFYLALMVSRALSGFLAHRLGVARFYLVYLLGALLFFCLAVALPFRIGLFVAVGWFVGPLFPLVTLITAQVFPKQKGTALGLVFAIGGLLGTFNSFLLGVMHDLFGARIGFSLMAVGLCVGIPLILYAQKRYALSTT